MNEWEKLFKQAEEKLVAAKALLESDEVDMKQVNDLRSAAKSLRERAEAMKVTEEELKAMREPVMPADLPVAPEGDGGNGEENRAESIRKAINVIRFGAIDAPTDLVMREVYGGDYRQIVFEQTKAFDHFLRTGRADKKLDRQLWSIGDVQTMLKDGLDVREIKATMVEGEDVLGGYAVPPTVAAGVIERIPGLTAVRGGGALIVQSASKVIEWLKVTGGNDQYLSGMRGLWGAETESPTEDDFTLGLVQIPVHVYTYKVSMSVSLLEDATNIVTIFTRLVSDTLAIDEDVAFLTGDGAGKPHGILPSSGNGRSLTEVITGDADEVTWDGLRNLRRGIATQYRARGRSSWIANSDTGGSIEEMQDGEGRNYVENALVVGDEFQGAIWRESEAMPDEAANAYPMIFGDLSGYAIVERLGMAVQRYNDSNTGINVVEFHIRRRLGGDLIEDYKFAVNKCSTT